MTQPIANDEDVIDSRDIIARIEDLESTFDSMKDDLEQAGWTFEQETEDLWWARKDIAGPQDPGPVISELPCESLWSAIAQADMQENPSGVSYVDEAAELRHLKALAEQCEGYGDWEHGETLIKENYFTQYIEELIDECYEMPKEMKSGHWPWRHFKMDFEAAAEEAKVDYTEVDFNDVTYLMRA